MQKLEDLGNGLNLRNYDNLATETKALTKKIEGKYNISGDFLKAIGNFSKKKHIKFRKLQEIFI